MSKNSIRAITIISFVIVAIALWVFDSLYEFLWFNDYSIPYFQIFFSLHNSHSLILKLLIMLILAISGVVIGEIFRQLLIHKENSDEIAENLNITLNSIGDAVISTDLEGNIVNMNPVAEQLTGWKINQAIGKDINAIFKIFNSYDNQETINPIHEVLATKKIVGLANHTKLVSKDGNEYQISDSAAPIIDSKGDITGVVLVFRNVTQEYFARQKLKESENRLRNIIENSTNLYYNHTANHELTYISPQCREYLQCEPEEAMVRWTEFATDNPINEIGFNNTKKAIETGERQPSYELELIGKKGKKIWVEVHEAPVVIDGKTVSIVGSLNDITNKKISESLLKESENRLRTVLENLPGALFAHDLDGNFILVNDETVRYTGYTKEELMKMNVSDIDPNSINRNDREKIWHFLEKGATQSIQSKHIRKDGTEYLVEVRLSAMIYDEIPMIIAIVLDKTVQITAQNKLQKSEERYRLLTGNMSDSIWMMDQNLKFTYLSPSTVKLFGYSIEEWETLEWDKFVHPDYLQAVVSAFKVLQDDPSQTSSTESAIVNHKNGRQMWIEFSVTTIQDENDDFCGFTGVTRDITERKQMEKKLDAGRKRYKTLFDSSPIALWEEDFSKVYQYLKSKNITDYEKFFDENPKELIECATNIKILDVNNEAIKMHKAQSKEQLIGNLSKIFNENSFSIFKKELIALMNGVSVIESEGEVVTLENDPLYINTKIMITEDHRAILSTADQTKQKLAEFEKQKLQDQLQQSQKLQAIGTLTGGIAHDFNNLLTPIMGYADLMRYKLPKDSPFMDYINDIIASSTKAKDLIQQLLTFSQKQQNKIEPISLVPIIKNSLKLLRASLPASININFNYDDDLGNILGNDTQIHQIIMNTCINSSHAMTKDNIDIEGKITISAQNVFLNNADTRQFISLNSGYHISLEIADNGCGMDDYTLSHIFEPFFSTKEEGKGTGMGLAVVHGIVQSYNGEIKVKSELNKGTTIRIYFPVIESQNIIQDQTKQSQLKSGTGNIFIVDDRPYVTNLITKMLDAFGYTITSTNSSQDALQKLLKDYQNYDLLITDMTMPEISGLELAKKLRENKINLPIILLTGHGANVKKTNDINAILEKPVLIEELLNRIDTFVGGKDILYESID